jgi:hypothetical protein
MRFQNVLSHLSSIAIISICLVNHTSITSLHELNGNGKLDGSSLGSILSSGIGKDL